MNSVMNLLHWVMGPVNRDEHRRLVEACADVVELFRPDGHDGIVQADSMLATARRRVNPEYVIPPGLGPLGLEHSTPRTVRGVTLAGADSKEEFAWQLYLEAAIMVLRLAVDYRTPTARVAHVASILVYAGAADDIFTLTEDHQDILALLVWARMWMGTQLELRLAPDDPEHGEVTRLFIQLLERLNNKDQE